MIATTAWICLLSPLVAAILITLAGTRISRRGAGDPAARAPRGAGAPPGGGGGGVGPAPATAMGGPAGRSPPV